MKIILIVLACFLAFVLLLVLRAVTLKPTAAKEAKVILDESPRASEYGQKLSKMVQVETVSARDQEDRTKYYEFHKVLEELFPNVHEKCEKHDFNGSLLYKWNGQGKAEPILLMSHQDVVEANGEWEHEPFSGDIDETGRVWG